MGMDPARAKVLVQRFSADPNQRRGGFGFKGKGFGFEGSGFRVWGF